MTTYSLATTGVRAGYPMTTLKQVTLPDDSVPASGVTVTTATLGGMQNAMRLGVPMLCKNADGSQSWYTLDAERSTPTVPVLRAV